MTQSKSINTMLNLTHLMIGWAIAVIGAIAFFLKTNVGQKIQIKNIDLNISYVIILLCVFPSIMVI